MPYKIRVSLVGCLGELLGLYDFCVGVFIGDAVFPFYDVKEMRTGLILVACWNEVGFGDSTEIDSIVFEFFGNFSVYDLVSF